MSSEGKQSWIEPEEAGSWMVPTTLQMPGYTGRALYTNYELFFP